MKRVLSFCRAAASAQITVYAANAAFFLLLSLFPAMALLMPLLGRFALSHREFFVLFLRLIPQELVPVFREAAELAPVPLMSLSALTALWSASRGIYGLLQGLRRVCPLRETRNTLSLRLYAIGYTAAFLLALLVTFSLYSLGQRMLVLLHAVDTPFGRFLRLILRARGGVALSFLTALFLLIFRTFPPERRSFRQAAPGALFSALGWVVFSRAFSVWARCFSDYSRVYGSAAVIAMTMLWLYACLSIILLGALINERMIKARRG